MTKRITVELGSMCSYTNFNDFIKKLKDSVPEEYQDKARIEIEGYEEYGNVESNLNISYWRPETRTEAKNRITLRERRERNQLNHERCEYEKLKKKFKGK